MIRHFLLIFTLSFIVFSLLLYDSQAESTCTITNYGVNSMFTDSSTCLHTVDILTPPWNILSIMKYSSHHNAVEVKGYYGDIFRSEYTIPPPSSVSDFSIKLSHEQEQIHSNVIECGGSTATGSGFLALNGELLDIDALAATTNTLLSSLPSYIDSVKHHHIHGLVATVNIEMKEDDGGTFYPTTHLFLNRTHPGSQKEKESFSISCDRKGLQITENMNSGCKGKGNGKGKGHGQGQSQGHGHGHGHGKGNGKDFSGICIIGDLSCSSTCSKLSASDQTNLFLDNLLSLDDNERSPAVQTAYEEASLLAKVQSIRKHLELYTYSEDFLSAFDECAENTSLNLAALSKLLVKISATVESWQWAVDDIVEYLESISDQSTNTTDFSTVSPRETDRPTVVDIDQVANLLKYRFERDTTSGTIYDDISYTSQDLFAEIVQDNLWVLQSLEIRALGASECQLSSPETYDALVSRCCALHRVQEDIYDNASENAKFVIDKAKVICERYSLWQSSTSRRRLLSDDSTSSYNGAVAYNTSTETVRYSDIDFLRSLRKDCAAAVPDNTWVTDSEIKRATRQCIVLYNDDSPLISFTASINLHKLAASREAEYNAKLQSNQHHAWVIVSTVLAVICTIGLIALLVILHNIRQLNRTHRLQVSIIQAGKQKDNEF